MLVTLNEILKMAEERGCAIGAFNTPNLECIRAVIDTAERYNVPVIISHAELHEEVAKVEEKRNDDPVVIAKLEHLRGYTDFSQVPEANAYTLAI